jgi:hypothetical protein
MKKTACFLIVLGVLAELITRSLYNQFVTSGDIIVPPPLHSIDFELVVSIIGILILWMASAQHSRHLRFAAVQTVSGLLILVLPLAYGYFSAAWLLLIVMVAALAVILSGFFQLILPAYKTQEE